MAIHFMRNLLLLIGLAALATLAYLALGTSKSTSSVASEGDENAEAGESPSDPTPAEFVKPRRMRSRENLSEDQLSLPKAKRMQGMGRGGVYTSNKGKGLRGPDETGEIPSSERQTAQAEVIARRSRQWLSDSDKDSDGFLSRSEAELGGSRLRRILEDFEAADGDGDGYINLEELQSATQAWRADRLERRQGR